MGAFDPYYTWLSIPPEEQPADYYRLLGVSRLETNLDVISHAADKQMMHLRSFQTGQHADASQKLLNELAAVRTCLLDPESKAAYDQQFRAKAAAEAAASRPAARQPELPVAEPLSAPPPAAEAHLPRAMPLRHSAPAPTPQQVAAAQSGSRTMHAATQPGAISELSSQRPGWLIPAVGGAALIVVAAVAFVVIRSSGTNPSGDQARVDAPAAGSARDAGQEARSAPTKQGVEMAADPAEQKPSVGEGADTKEDSAATTSEAPAQESKPEEGKRNASEPEPTPAKPAVAPPAGTEKAPSETKPEPPTSAPPAEAPPPERPSAEPEPAVKKKPAAPSDEATGKARELVQEVFGADITAAKTAAQRSALAKRFIQSAQTEQDEAARYVLLVQAGELAVQAGDGALIAGSVDSLAEHYDVDALKLKARSYFSASKLNLDAQASSDLVDRVLHLSDEAAAVHRFEIAVPLTKVAQTFARKVGSRDLFKRIAAQIEALEERKSRFQAAEQAAQALSENPDDPAANLVYGKYLTLVEGDWQRGLPLLARSGDEGLKRAAAADLLAPTKAAKQTEVGDAWYDVATDDKSLESCYARAYSWYNRALPSLVGLEKARVAKRLDETAQYAAASAAVSGQAFEATATLRKVIAAHTSHLTALAFSPDGRMLASGSLDHDIKLWDVATGEAIKTVNANCETRSLVFAPDGKTLLSAGTDYAGKFWSIATGQVQRTIKDCAYLALSRDGKTLAVFNPHIGVTSLWDTASGQPRVALEDAPRCSAPRLSADGRVLVAVSEQGIHVWNTQTGKIVHTLPLPGAQVNDMALSPDRKLLAIVENGGTLITWNVASGTQRQSIQADPNYLLSVAFSPDGNTLVTGGTDLALKLWNPQTGKLRQSVPDEYGRISTVAFSPDGKTIATGSWSSKVTLWDVEMKPVSAPDVPAPGGASPGGTAPFPSPAGGSAATQKPPVGPADAAELSSEKPARTKLEERMIGNFQVAAVNKKAGEQFSQSMEFKDDGQVIERGKDAIATWALDESQILVTFTDAQRGTVRLRPQKDGFAGTQVAADGQTWTWLVQPIVVAAVWEIQTREGTNYNKFTLYSNGKANDPHGDLTWTLKGRSLTVHFPDDPAGFTLDPGGRTMTGRWLRGGNFVGRLVQAKTPSN